MVKGLAPWLLRRRSWWSCDGKGFRVECFELPPAWQVSLTPIALT